MWKFSPTWKYKNEEVLPIKIANSTAKFILKWALGPLKLHNAIKQILSLLLFCGDHPAIDLLVVSRFPLQINLQICGEIETFLFTHLWLVVFVQLQSSLDLLDSQ